MRILMIPLMLLSLGLCGCGSIPNPITTDRVVVIKESYGVALSAAVAYRDSCAQRILPPSCRTVVPRLVAANRRVEIALSRLSSLEALGPAVDLTEAINALSDAVNDLKLLVPGG